MLYLTCTTITSVDVALYVVSHAKDWVSVDCGTSRFTYLNFFYLISVILELYSKPIKFYELFIFCTFDMEKKSGKINVYKILILQLRMRSHLDHNQLFMAVKSGNANISFFLSCYFYLTSLTLKAAIQTAADNIGLLGRGFT